jgi:single-stranded-DNA-specific exonuclease
LLSLLADYEPREKAYQWLDLVALATVADIVPLLDENRILVKYGLEAMQNTRRPGLRADSNRPAEFNRGASKNPTCQACILLPFSPAS